MIEWKKYDPNNPPNFGQEFLIYTNYGSFKVAELERWSDGELVWTENQEQLTVHDVKYYAEINLPPTE